MENYSNKDWSNLPTHKPDADLWDRIDTELDLEQVSKNLGQLPKYSPKLNLWKSIHSKLFFYQNLNYFYAAGIGITAIALFFIFINTFNTEPKIKQSNLVHEELSANQRNYNKQDGLSLKNTNAFIEGKGLLSKPVQTKILNVSENINSIKLHKKVKTLNTIKILRKLNETAQLPKDEKKQIINEQIREKDKPLYISDITEQTVVENLNKEQLHNLIQKEHENKRDENTKLPISLSSDTNQNITETINNNDINGIDPKRINLKSANIPVKKSLYSVGIDYTFSKIYNAEKFSYSDNKTLGQYGISLKYNYSSWIMQTGFNYSRFSDNFTYNSDQKQILYESFNYVDSVIYNSQGNIIQYITHPVSLKDSILFQQLIKTTKKYSLLNIPLTVAYQYGFGKIFVSLKAGILCSFIISEKETMVLPDNAYTSVLKIYTEHSNINKTNWAGLLSIEFDYHLNKYWGISVEPTMQYYFKPLYKEMDINTNLNNLSPYLIGLKTGLFYKF
ncbi:MAG: hypothetical protein HXX18_02990 [Bacteroidetes bacterium]|nr:hypothetical protein [Bacteroidota bacterium]